MTREEATKHIYSVGRTCRGKSLFSKEQRDQLAVTGNAVLSPYNHEAALAFKRSLEQVLGQEDKPVNDVNEMTQRLIFLIYARPDAVGRPCGYDYNQFVVSNPWDGQIYETKCPLCGEEDKYQAPIYNVED